MSQKRWTEEARGDSCKGKDTSFNPSVSSLQVLFGWLSKNTFFSRTWAAEQLEAFGIVKSHFMPDSWKKKEVFIHGILIRFIESTALVRWEPLNK